MSELLTEPLPLRPESRLPEDRASVNVRKAAIVELKEKGFSAREISKITGYSENSVNVIYCEIKKKKDPFHAIRPSALRSLKKYVTGQKIGDIEPKSGDIMKATEMVLNRTDPIIQHVQNEIQVTVNRGCDTQSVDNQGSISVDKSIIDVTP